MLWSKISEVLKITCKEKIEGRGGREAHFFAISYGKGIILCEQCLASLGGELFNDFVCTLFQKHLKTVAIRKRNCSYKTMIPLKIVKRQDIAFEGI